MRVHQDDFCGLLLERTNMLTRLVFGLLGTTGLLLAATGWTQTVSPIPDELREKFKLDPFYQ